MSRSEPPSAGPLPVFTPSEATPPAARDPGTPRRSLDERASRALHLLIMRVPDRMALHVIAAVCVTLSTMALLVAGALAETEIGPFLQQIFVVGVTVPVIVVMPFATVMIRLVRDLEAERVRAVETAGVDELTGLANRRTLVSGLERDLGLARRMRTQLTLALLDVDDFKSVNDTHGHAVGDALLRAVAAACRRTARSTDVVGRWGGEEFVIVLPDTGAQGAEVILERLRTAIGRTTVDTGRAGPLSRTVSIGAVTIDPACAHPGGHSIHGLIAIADRAMYRSKVAGKDRLTVEVLVPPARDAAPAQASAACTSWRNSGR